VHLLAAAEESCSAAPGVVFASSSSEDAAWTGALRDLMRDDPPTACRLAHALRDGDWKDVIRLRRRCRSILAQRPTFADLMQTPTRSAIRRDLRRRRV